MGELLAAAIPLALGAAISPLVFLAQLATLTGPRPLARGSALAAGAALPLVVVGAAALALGGAVSLQTSPRLAAWVGIGFGAILLALALLRIARPAPRKPKSPHTGASARRSFSVGVVMMLSNVTTFALFIPAVKEIAAHDVAAAGKVVAAVLVLAITLSLSLVPLALVALAPGPSRRLLGAIGEFMQTHHRGLQITLLLGFGAYLLTKGLIAL